MWLGSCKSPLSGAFESSGYRQEEVSHEKKDVLAAVHTIPGVHDVIDELTLRRDPGPP